MGNTYTDKYRLFLRLQKNFQKKCAGTKAGDGWSAQFIFILKNTVACLSLYCCVVNRKRLGRFWYKILYQLFCKAGLVFTTISPVF